MATMSTLGLSTHGLKPVPLSASVHHSDPFIFIERQSRQLQHELQALLDAQSAGLSAEQAPSHENLFSTGSSTPTQSHSSGPKSAITVPVRQPPAKKVGLRAARRGILRSIHNLLTLKEEESRIINSEIARRQDVLKEVIAFDQKKSGLEKSISDIRNDDQKPRADELSREIQALDTEIDELEVRLAEMKARRSCAVDEISQIRNSVDAKLSSYEAALSLVKSNVQKFLKNPPIKQSLLLHSPSTPSFYSLSPGRRTLEMVRQHWDSEVVHLQERLEVVEGEVGALKSGGNVWNTVIETVAGFEKGLRNDMKRLQGAGQSRSPNQASLSSSIMKRVDDVIQSLETDLRSADTNGWNLLICSIGAELEAFRQARETLATTFSDPEDSDDQRGTMVGDVPGDLLDAAAAVETQSENEGSRAEDKPVGNTKHASPGHSSKSQSDEEEYDDPDPAWLL